MYNGQQPPYMPGNPSPFPPSNGAPQPGYPHYFPPPGYPPFPPPGFAPGMLPPTGISPTVGSPVTPGMAQMQMQGTPIGIRPPPMGYAPRSAHPGLGSQPSHGTLQPTSSQQAPRSDVKTTKVFVGGIAPGITDEVLTNLLNACGPLHELKRVSGANGQPQSFAFAMYENPEVVLRAIRCLNGVELPDMSPAGRSEKKPAKKLIIKAEEKTQAFLQEFESTLGRSDSDEEADASTRKSIQHIIALLTDPNAQHPDGSAANLNGHVEVFVPPHLQDLQEGDLPEEQRKAVLGQIAVFRESAAKREREKRLMEEEKERYKTMQQQQGANRTPAATSGYGYGNRGLGKQQQQAEMFKNQHTPSPARQNSVTAGPSKQRERDPQAYDKPLSFVKAQTAETKAESGRSDEEEEELRRQKIQREKDIALRDAERRVEARERTRIDALNRELGHRKTQKDVIERNKMRQEDMYENWDDDELSERGRELFYADRYQWRARRQKFRQSEYQADLRDRQHEEDERQALERESEEFLKQQMAELAELEKTQRARGFLTEDAAPIKLAMNRVALPTSKEEKKPAALPKSRVQLQGDEDEEDNGQKKKRTLVRLDE
ncbi:uncharacterized protein L203_100676 [Cryptococcus depauperatus CBS 7841]|uniref:RRM domain-containing protein n=1 Tax=Cryptococcus depauperatus CBS 7841 TaxID=1295531 RepID=A0AAJ8JNJ6_9TREE